MCPEHSIKQPPPIAEVVDYSALEDFKQASSLGCSVTTILALIIFVAKATVLTAKQGSEVIKQADCSDAYSEYGHAVD